MKEIKSIIQQSISVKQGILQDQELINKINQAVELSVSAFKAKKQLLFCGNGGSAADAQHLAAEFSGRFYIDRPPLNAEALHVNTSYLTAVANDYSYDEIYSRLVMAKGSEGGVLFALSTSGNSKNILLALETAQKIGMKTIGMSGNGGGKMNDFCDINLIVPSNDTPRIQESHILIGHIICELVEKSLFEK